MFEHMVEVNDLLPSFRKYDLTEKDVIFIKELIAGTALDRGGDQVPKNQDCRIKEMRINEHRYRRYHYHHIIF